ncbi:MAG: TIGR02757 family protein [Bacteroidetes bacterium GWF2_42_66]|nr:MAG: TIGR02757 family protein [Bacteroidetes bacterium GWA2_42_15]OFY02817.1 MAG: TIGR02757 family protein [Bacteroidetes bacterium GWE2_42_39]OFY44471.1 MAG: TIGR02757 family protein [Bacteroidetes bacterium GWF2_42_66]HBL74984.1 TIGR02757 family protein [Prolixibacteraceae bacterium]HCR89108.1 TIGR02757 family protein [Prolixibacteraceae bacterium]
MYTHEELYQLLEEKVKRYNHPGFITSDPVQIPRRFSKKENIEIAGFLAATIAWGQRPVIIKNAHRLMQGMDNNPYQFLLDTTEADWLHLADFKHRTFNSADLFFFLKSLQNIYKNHGGLEQVFTEGYQSDQTVFSALTHFRRIFFEIDSPHRTQKHISDVSKNSSAKRLNMFLRWMVRNDNAGVDFGLWKNVPSSALMLPLDVHTGNISRQLGLLQRTQNDWKAVVEVTSRLAEFDPTDPVKYDFALFGMGVFDNF